MKSLLRGCWFITLALLSLTAAASPDHWADEINRLTSADATSPPPQHAVVFVGSSSIRFWKSLPQDFPGIATINRGFGGSELADSVYYADRLVIAYHPRTVVLYAGDNDLWAGKTAEMVAADFTAFHTKIHTALPDTKLIFLSIKPSPSRLRVWPQAQHANQLIAAECAQDQHCVFVDVATPLLDAAGKTRSELYREDQLHMLPAGYSIWTQVLAPYLQP